MVFNKEVNISDFINIILLLLNVVGTIIAIWEIRSARKQLKIEIIPYLLIKDKTNISINDIINTEIFPSFCIENIGNGIAQNINISVVLEKDFFKKSPYVKIIDNKYLELSYMKNKINISCRKINIFSNISYSVQILKSGENFVVDSLSSQAFIYAFFNVFFADQIDLLDFEIPVFRIYLTYDDLLGNNYEATYYSYIKVINKLLKDSYTIQFKKK